MKQLYTHLKVALTFVVLLASFNSYSQNVGINATGVAPAASAGLDVNFSNKGVLIPNVALTGINDATTIASPATSLLVYNTVTANTLANKVTPGYYYYTGTAWARLNTQFTTSDSDISYTTGSLNVGTSISNASAIFNVSATNKGVLIPRVALTGTADVTTIASPTASLLVYNTAIAGNAPNNVTEGYYYYTGTAWTRLANGNISVSGWGTTGTPSTTNANFLGTTDARPLYFRTNTASSGSTNRMQIESGGNVGIGLNSATTASYKLQVGATSNPLFLSGVQDGVNTDSTLTIASGVVRKLPPMWSVKGNALTDSATYFIGTTDAKPLKFKTAATQRMIIKENGRFGLGTTLTDSAFITVNAGTVAANNTGFPTLMSLEGSRSGYLQFNVQNNDGGVKASTDIVATANNGTEEASYIDMGINSGGYSSGGNALLNGANTAYLYANGGKMFIGNAASNEPLIFFTNSGSASDEDANGAERMRILSSGEVAIGTTSVTSGVKLEVNGNIKATNVTYSSDKRLKKNIESLNYGLTDILKFKPVTYNWIDAQQGNEKQIGLIAQEARSIIPEVVLGDEQKEKLSVNYTQLIPVLINAIKEQQKQIEDLKKVVADLQKK